MNIALIHDWLRVNAGSEKVVSEILSMYKEEQLELYTLFKFIYSKLFKQRKPKYYIIKKLPFCFNKKGVFF